MSGESAQRIRLRDIAWFGFGVALPVPWIVAHALGGMGIPAEYVLFLAGFAVLGAAFMLSWSCEIAERDIPQSLALLVLALVGVLPEYAVDLHFAWVAGYDASYEPYAVANMTGANRLLIGLGWAAVVLSYCWAAERDEVQIAENQKLELRFLIWATIYSFTIPLSGTINLFDAVVLLSLFAAYVRSAMAASHEEEEELMGPAFLIDDQFTDVGRRRWAAFLFLFAAYGIWVSAEPFAESLVHVGRNYDVDEFLLVQWLAPIASEAPEFIVAILFALRLRGSVGMGALVSSKVNQWTLLVGAIPIAYALSSGSFAGLPLDDRQTSELYLTSAQSLFAAILLSDLRFTRKEGIALAVLFVAQLLFASPVIRWGFTGLYLVLGAFLLMKAPPNQRQAFFALMFSLPSSDRRKAGAESEP